MPFGISHASVMNALPSSCTPVSYTYGLSGGVGGISGFSFTIKPVVSSAPEPTHGHTPMIVVKVYWP